MSVRPRDTNSEAQRFQWDAYRGMGTSGRFDVLTAMCGFQKSKEVNVDHSLEAFLTAVVERLDRAAIDYMVVGSVAVGLMATPRFTQDIDVVVSATPDQAEALGKLFEVPFYVGDLRTAAETLGMDNVIDPSSGWKVDLIWRGDSDFDESSFSRRTLVDVAGKQVWVQSASDAVISKLLWARATESEMQLRDVANLLGVADIDLPYVDHWVQELDLQDLLDKVDS